MHRCDNNCLMNTRGPEQQGRPEITLNRITALIRTVMPDVSIRLKLHGGLEVSAELVWGLVVRQQPAHPRHIRDKPTNRFSWKGKQTSETYLLKATQPSRHLYSLRVSQTSPKTWRSTSSRGKLLAEVLQHLMVSVLKVWAAGERRSTCKLCRTSLSFESRRFLQVLNASWKTIGNFSYYKTWRQGN